MSKLEGHVAVITGANKGLGQQMAEALARAGAAVALVARTQDLLESVADGIRASGGRAEVIVADITEEAGVNHVARQVQSALGVCDILINNAGINTRKNVEDFSLSEWNQIVGVNLPGPFLTCRAFVPGMKEKGWGRIINMTSIMSHVSIPQRIGYSSTKFGLLGMVKALALELAPHNITVNGISPGPFGTEMNQAIMNDPALNQQFVSRIPLGR
jgi:NAD(P)-dependent dehydrogenase (short-subunit alcohol dehydrogenase family)